MSTNLSYTAIVEREGDGYVALCPELDVASQGTTVEDAMANAAGEAPPCPASPDSMAMLLYTSGTTGAAKGVCITHGSLVMHTQALVEQTLRLTEEDRILGTLPLTHSYGIRMTLLVPFFAGARTVFVPKFSPSRTLELCTAHEITWLPGVPTMFVAALEQQQGG